LIVTCHFASRLAERFPKFAPSRFWSPPKRSLSTPHVDVFSSLLFSDVRTHRQVCTRVGPLLMLPGGVRFLFVVSSPYWFRFLVQGDSFGPYPTVLTPFPRHGIPLARLLLLSSLVGAHDFKGPPLSQNVDPNTFCWESVSLNPPNDVPRLGFPPLCSAPLSFFPYPCLFPAAIEKSERVMYNIEDS